MLVLLAVLAVVLAVSLAVLLCLAGVERKAEPICARYGGISAVIRRSLLASVGGGTLPRR